MEARAARFAYPFSGSFQSRQEGSSRQSSAYDAAVNAMAEQSAKVKEAIDGGNILLSQPDGFICGVGAPEGGLAGRCGLEELPEEEACKPAGTRPAGEERRSLEKCHAEAASNQKDSQIEQPQGDECAQQEPIGICLEVKGPLVAALDVAPPRPCRSSARVSEKEKRELENAAAREQGLGPDQDSRDSSSRDRGRKERERQPAGKSSKGLTGALVEEGTKEEQEVRSSGELVEAGEQQKQSVVLGNRSVEGGKDAAAAGADASAIGKAACKGVPSDLAGEKTKKAAYWTFEEEESFFNSLRQFGKNFERIQAKVKSKDKEQVRHYYYRCIKRMNKLLQPGMILDISNPLVVNTAMLRWWQVRVEVKGDITDLHRKPRKHKQFQTAFEKAFAADLQRKSKARQKQAAFLAKQPAGDAAQGQAAAAAPTNWASTSALLGTCQSQSMPTRPVENTAAQMAPGRKPEAIGHNLSSPLHGIPTLLLSSSNNSIGGPLGKSHEQQATKAKKRVSKKELLGSKARKAIEAVQLAGAKRKAAAGGRPPTKAGQPQKESTANQQQGVGSKGKLGAGQGGKRGRAEDKVKTKRMESAPKKAKGRGKGAGEVIDDVGTAPDTSTALSRGPGRPRKAILDLSKGDCGGATPSLAGLAEAAAQMEKLEHARGTAMDGGVVLPVNGSASMRGGAKAEGGEGQGEGKLTLQLFPCDDDTEARVKKAGFVPFLELTLKARKSLASIAQHLVAKWSLDKDPALVPPDGRASLAGCTVRLLPNIDPGEAVSKYSWGVADKSVAAAEVFALVGKPAIFRLKYRLLPHDMLDRKQHESWPPLGPAGIRSPLRPSSMGAPQYQPTLCRGPPVHQVPPPSSPGHFLPSPSRGHAAGTGPSPRAFSWVAEEAAGAWEPHAPRYMLVSNNAPLGRGPGSGGGFGEGVGQEGSAMRGAGDAGPPTEGGGWLDEVEGVSISGFLNSEGSRGFTDSPCLVGDRSRSSLGLPSPSLSSFVLSPEQQGMQRTPFRAPADRVPGLGGRPRSRLHAASALLGSITEDRESESLAGLEDGTPPLQEGGRQSAEPAASWVPTEDAVALPLKDLVPSDSFSGLAPILDTFGMAMSTDGFDIQAWDKCSGWASRSSAAPSPAKADEGLKRSPVKQLPAERPPSRDGEASIGVEERPEGDTLEQSVDEADQLRVLEGGSQEEREQGKGRPDPDLYWGNSLGGFEEQRTQPPPYASSATEDFLLKAPTPVDIPFGDSLLLRALESSNDGFLPSAREASGKAGRRGSARRASFGRSKSSGDIDPEGKRIADSGSTEKQPLPSSPAKARGAQGVISRSQSASPEDRAQLHGPEPTRTAVQLRSATPPAGGSGSHFRLDKSLLGDEATRHQEPPPAAGGEPAKPFVALFPDLPGQLTREELLPPAPPASAASSMPDSTIKAMRPTGANHPQAAEVETNERPSKRKAKTKPKADGRSKLQKKDSDSVQLGKRAADLSQANKAAAAALNSCFGKSVLAKSSWQNAT